MPCTGLVLMGIWSFLEARLSFLLWYPGIERGICFLLR